MKKLIIIAFVLMSFVGFSQEPYTTMTSYANTNIVNNATNSITGFMLNKMYNDIIITMQAQHYDITKPYTADTSVVLRSDVLYRCIIDNSAGAFNALHWKAIAFADADSIVVENIRALTDTTTHDSLQVFHDAVGINAQAVSDIPLSLSGNDDLVVKITGANDTSIYINTTGTAANTIGYYATITGGTNSTIAVEGHAVTTVKTIPANSYAGVYGQSGSATKHNYGVIGTTITSSIGDNVAGYFNTLNGGAGDAYVLRLVDGATNTNKLLRTDASGNMEWGVIQDDKTTVGINVAPHASRQLDLSTGLQYGMYSLSTHTAATAYGLWSQSSTSNANSNIAGYFNSQNGGAGDAIGMFSLAAGSTGGIVYAGYFNATSTSRLNYGVYSDVAASNSANNVGLAAVGSNAGSGEYYTLRLDDGTTMTGKVPIAIDADGHVEMSDTVETNTGFKFNDTGTMMFDTLIDISSGDILTSNGTPIILVVAKGANKAIIPISIAIFLDWNSAAYTTNTVLGIKHDGATGNITRTTDLLTSVADTPQLLGIGSSSTAVDLVLNADLILYTSGGNPAAGDSPIRVVLTYMIVDLQ